MPRRRACRRRPQVADIGPVFHGLFRSSGEREPVAPLVNSLWTHAAQPPAPAAPSRAGCRADAPRRCRAGAQAGGELGLFQDQLPDARALFRGRV